MTTAWQTLVPSSRHSRNDTYGKHFEKCYITVDPILSREYATALSRRIRAEKLEEGDQHLYAFACKGTNHWHLKYNPMITENNRYYNEKRKLHYSLDMPECQCGYHKYHNSLKVGKLAE